jgi:hypothetical protein
MELAGSVMMRVEALRSLGGAWLGAGTDRPIDRGWQGKSAAFGPAHVVGGVEVLRRDESSHAVAALRNLRQINARRASVFAGER